MCLSEAEHRSLRPVCRVAPAALLATLWRAPACRVLSRRVRDDAAPQTAHVSGPGERSSFLLRRLLSSGLITRKAGGFGLTLRVPAHYAAPVRSVINDRAKQSMALPSWL